MEFQNINMNTILLTKEERQYNEGEIVSLAKSISLIGLMTPITVRKLAHSDRFEIISGNKRYFAFRLLGYNKIPSVIVETKPNVARVAIKRCEKSDVFKEADRVKKLFTSQGENAEEIADATGYSVKEIVNLLKLTKFTDFEKEAIKKNSVSFEIACEIAFFDDVPTRCALLGEVIQRRLKLKETISLCEKERIGKRTADKRKAVRSPKFRDLRLFDNTLSRAVSLLKEAGVKAEIDSCRKSGMTEYTILIAE